MHLLDLGLFGGQPQQRRRPRSADHAVPLSLTRSRAWREAVA